MKTAEIRSSFLSYFEGQGHKRTPPGPLVPANDPSLLFTSAGMVPFKGAFLGEEKPPAPTCTSAQPCLRAGGKHNDLENVGYTKVHHTLFEMLGNFSFGDYFKEGAIEHAWAYLLQGLQLDPQRLWISVHHSDEESAALWRKIGGVDEGRILRLGDEDNFWAMGDVGPCGPCSEIYYDRGADIPGGLPGSPDEGERYVEIWNLVFMQFLQEPGGGRQPLQTPCVDTGMGLERVSAVLQDVDSNYDIDLFRVLLDAVGDDSSSGRVVADHLRAVSFLIAEGLEPSNEGRGYVLRRILRRAARHIGLLSRARGGQLRLAPLTGAVVEAMGEAYPVLRERAGRIAEVVAAEEEQFGETLERGLAIFERERGRLAAGAAIPGELAFTLYDTYGFPLDMTLDMAREQGVEVDVAGFERCMAEQKERGRSASGFASAGGVRTADLPAAEFVGYDGLEGEGEVVALFSEEGQRVEALESGQGGWLALDRTPFYAESGGQVGDRGVLRGADGVQVQVSDCQVSGEQRLHRVQVGHGRLRPGERLQAQVDQRLRAAAARNHSATHLLNGALREFLGEVEQRGSWVGATGLRFDISHPGKIPAELLRKLEDRVNALILANTEATTRVMPIDEAKAAGAIALFGEKYGEQVRVLEMGAGYSIELCGGTHVQRTGDIGMFLITGESSVAAGVRRIEGVTGEGAMAEVRARQARMDQLCEELGVGPEGAAEKLAKLQADLKQVREEMGQLQRRMAKGGGADVRKVEVGGALVQLLNAPGLEGKPLRQALGDLERAGAEREAAWLVVSETKGKLSFMAAASESMQGRLGADALLRQLIATLGGKGGGKPSYAAGGGGDPAKLDEAWSGVEEWARGLLSHTD